TPAPAPLLGLDSAYWFKIIEAAIMCVTALLIGLFVARPLISRMFAPNPPAQMLQIPNGSPAPGPLPAPAQAGQAAAAATAEGGQAALPAPQPGIDLSHIEGRVGD